MIPAILPASPDQVITTPFGKFLVNAQDLIESTLKAGTLWDGPGFLQVIAREYAHFHEPGVTILDVGANVGSFSIYCASQGAWRVIAVEPVPWTMQRLKANLDLNREITAQCVIPLEIAAYHKDHPLFAPPVDPTNVGGTTLSADNATPDGYVVKGRELDDFRWLFGETVSLIKIDAQGCDGCAIMGLQETIQRFRPVIVYEWEPQLAQRFPYTQTEVERLLRSYDYTIQPWPSQQGNYLAIPPDRRL